MAEFSLAEIAPSDRVRRGIILFRDHSEEIEPQGRGRYRVGKYAVDLGVFHDEPEVESCTCPDFTYRHETCKHLVAASIYRAKARARERARRRRRRQEPVREVVAALERMGA